MANCSTCKHKKLIGSMCGCDGVYSERCYQPAKPKPTNADRIRSMSDEELADWMTRYVDCDKDNVLCIPELYKNSGKCNGQCRAGHLRWLQRPAEECNHETN